jgi:3-hydroxyisobutyrate dehydrogenase-like beta-hydroxyacid dehydrogenase
MGSAIARRLVTNGMQVLVNLEGRSAESAKRAHAAGVTPVTPLEFADADLVLSVVPPDAAVQAANGFAAGAKGSSNPPIYVDCNAIQPKRSVLICESMRAAGIPFVDGSIIGAVPSESYAGPTLFVSGPRADEVLELNRAKLVVKSIGPNIGAASAIKMCYGAITKGHIALGAAMLLAAERADIGDALLAEMGLSLKGFLDGYKRSIPDMFAKAQRWVPEMEEIAGFLGDDRAEKQVYLGLARLYQQLADDFAGDQADISRLAAIVS